MVGIKDFYDWHWVGGAHESGSEVETAVLFANHCVKKFQTEIDALKVAQTWQPIESAPRDGSAVRLLVDGGDFPLTEDDLWETIGNFGVGEDQSIWTFAGWDWSHDCYCEGNGRVVGWMPLPPAPETAK